MLVCMCKIAMDSSVTYLNIVEIFTSLLPHVSLGFLSLQIRTVKVSNLSLGATEQDIKEFFSFSGEIEYVDMHRLVFE